MAPPIARSPDDGDDADIRHDSGGHESRLAIVFARILALDIRGIQKNLACDLEVEAALRKTASFLAGSHEKPSSKSGSMVYHTPLSAYTQ